MPRREANIRNADVVLLKTYNFRDDETGRRLRELLLERVLAKKKVVIQYDYKGYYSKDPKQVLKNRVKGMVASEHLVPEEFSAMLTAAREAGCDEYLTVVPTNANSANPLYGKDHEKYLITWSRGEPARLIMGGMNVGDEWAFGGDPARRPTILGGETGFRDTDVEITGPVVKRVVEEFVRDAERALEQLEGLSSCAHDAPQHARILDAAGDILEASRSSLPPTGRALVRFVANRPELREAGQTIEELYVLLLSRVPAGDTVTIISPFFLPSDRLVEAIKSAARRGVHVELIQNHPKSSDTAFRTVAFATRSLDRELLRDPSLSTIKIYEWIGNAQHGVSSLHHKMARFGERGPILIGSSNLDAQSLVHNTEGVVLIADRTTSEEFDAMLREDRAMGALRELTRAAVERDGPLKRSRQWLRRQLFGGVM